MEIEIAGAADTTIVVVNPGWGDSVQANKAGLLEIADLFVINKADRPGVDETRRDLELMLELSTLGDWRPPILSTVASTGEGLDELRKAIDDHRAFVESSGDLEDRRRRRMATELREIVMHRIEQRADEVCGGGAFDALLAKVLAREIDPYTAAADLLDGSA